MASPSGVELVGELGKKDGLSANSVEEVASIPSIEAQAEGVERKSQIDAVWEQMNRGISFKTPKSFTRKPSSNVNKASGRTSHNWMTYLGMAPKKLKLPGQEKEQKEPFILQNGASDETKRLAAAALSYVKDAAATASGKGKVEVSEVRDFAGEEIEVKKLVNADSKEASARGPAAASSSVDAILEQIKKKPKLSVLDKTKKDWGEFKEEKGLEEELDAYKKSSNQYLEKVSFLERTDYREFERERDARLALQARRRLDNMQD